MKKTFRVLSAFLACSMVVPLAACGGNSFSQDDYSLFAEREGDGYVIKIRKDDVTYSTSGGALGVRFDKNEFRADEPIYVHYEKVEKTDGGFAGTGSVSSNYGTVIGFEDYYTIAGGEVAIDRTVTVVAAGEDCGFMTELRFVDEKEGTVLGSDWLIPSTYYITGEHTFADTSTRMYFNGTDLAIPADDVSVLTVSRYTDGKYLSMTDVTAGFRENIIEDNDAKNTAIYISADINTPGIVVGEEGGKVAISHVYPAYVNRKADIYTWRMLPIEKGFSRTVGIVIRIGKAESYSQMLRDCWRTAYSRFGFADKRYTVSDVYETLITALADSYSERNLWNIPQYMTNTDHYIPDSGFLYRNLEFATLMLKEGRARGDKIMVDNAWKVIRNQLDNDRLDTRISGYMRDNSVFKRVLFEGLEAAVKLYIYESKSGKGDKEFLSGLLDYIIDKAEKYRDEDSAMALSFYMALWRYQDEMFLDYGDVAKRILQKAYTDCEDYKGYYGGVESSNTLISVAEDYMILFRAFLDAYELDGKLQWLEKAVTIGDYLETYQMIQPFSLALIGATGNEGYNLAFMGNERFLAYGYIYNNTQHGILDIANTSSVIDYYRLYEYTQDEHYLKFAEDKLYSALSYVNMGDKVGHMDDLVHSAGKGFMNEFVGNATTVNGYADAGIRGAAHDSNLGWNVWQIVSIVDWFAENRGGMLPEEMKESLTHDLAQNRYITGDSVNAAYSAQKAVDGSPHTHWLPAGDKCAVIDLNEYCLIENISVTAVSAGASVKVAFSENGVEFGEAKTVVFTEKTGSVSVEELARYVKVISDTKIGIAEIRAEGKPVLYETLSYGAEIVSSEGGGNVKNCLDESNYQTIWNTSAEVPSEVVLDLGANCKIFQTAIKPEDVADYAYKIEISSDGVHYMPYAEWKGGTEKSVFVDQGYAEARFVKLTLISSQSDRFSIADFKVMGTRI